MTAPPLTREEAIERTDHIVRWLLRNIYLDSVTTGYTATGFHGARGKLDTDSGGREFHAAVEVRHFCDGSGLLRPYFVAGALQLEGAGPTRRWASDDAPTVGLAGLFASEEVQVRTWHPSDDDAAPSLPGPSEPWFVRSHGATRLIKHLDPAAFCDAASDTEPTTWWRRLLRWLRT